MAGGFQIFKLKWLSYLLVHFYQMYIKIFCLESSVLIDILFFYIVTFLLIIERLQRTVTNTAVVDLDWMQSLVNISKRIIEINKFRH